MVDKPHAGQTKRPEKVLRPVRDLLLAKQCFATLFHKNRLLHAAVQLTR